MVATGCTTSPNDGYFSVLKASAKFADVDSFECETTCVYRADYAHHVVTLTFSFSTAHLDCNFTYLYK